jgi:cytochrome b involved in lipid metabolism
MSPPLPPQDKESKKTTSSLLRRKERDIREEEKLQHTETKKGRQLSSSSSSSSLPLKSQFSSQEVWKHNTKDSCWLTIHGRVYDVTLWLQSHPGGSDLLLAAAGRDATQLFEMYHPFVLISKEGEKQIKKRLESCCIGFLKDYKPHYLTDSGFYQKTSRKVWKHLKNSNIDSRGLQPFLQSLAIISFFILSSYLFSFLYPLLSSSFFPSSSAFFSFSFVLLLLRFLSSIIFGISSGLFEAHCKHDTSHGVLIRRHPYLHNFIVFCDEFLLGGSLWAWLHQHVIGHHVFTNVAGLDPDLPMPSNSSPLPSSSSSLFEKKTEVQWKEAEIRRVTSLQPSLPRYYLQHLYVPLLYAAVALKSRLEDITWTFFKRANGPVSVAPIPIWRWVRLFSSKSSFLFFRLVLPLLVALQYQPNSSSSSPFMIFAQEVLPYFFISEVAMGTYLETKETEEEGKRNEERERLKYSNVNLI